MKKEIPDEIEEKKSKKDKKRKLAVLEEVEEEETLDKKIKDANKIIYGDRFEIDITQLIGKGAFGEIYIAWDLTNLNNCALKRVIFLLNNSNQLFT